MPPDVREWLPAGHLGWFVIDAVGEMDLVRRQLADAKRGFEVPSRGKASARIEIHKVAVPETCNRSSVRA